VGSALFTHAVKIAKIFGIDVEVDFSWLIIFMVFSYNLSINYFPAVLPGQPEIVYLLLGTNVTLLLFVSVLVHEFAHSLTAIQRGHNINKITLFIFGGVAHLEEEPRTSLDELTITIVGPLSSFLLAVGFGVLYLLIPQGTPLSAALFFLARVNLTIGIVNLVPAFPLDGGRILRSIVWNWKKDLLYATKVSVMAGSAFAFLLMGIGFIVTLTVSVAGLWYIFLGWLLYQAGQNSYSQVSLKNTLSGIRVKDVMTSRVVVVSTELSVDELIDRFYMYKVGAFPVMGGSEVKGIVTMNQVKNVERRKWETVKVKDIMTPIEQCIIYEPDDEAVDAMMGMAKENAGRVLVMQDGQLVGILSNTDMMRLVKMKTLFKK